MRRTPGMNDQVVNSGSPNLLVQTNGAIAIVTINRPDRMNALDEATIRIFQQLLQNFIGTDVRAVVIAGAGVKAFCSGDDLKAVAERSPDQRSAMSNTTYWLEFTDRVEELPFPVIAAIEGYCLGGGLELALACDLRIVGASATLGLPEVNLSALPSAGATYRLPRVVGLGRAREMIQFGRRLTAAEAKEWGLVAEVVPEGTALQRAMEVARWASAISPNALARAKAIVTFSYSIPTASARYLTAIADSIQLASDDFRTGVSRFAAHSNAAGERTSADMGSSRE